VPVGLDYPALVVHHSAIVVVIGDVALEICSSRPLDSHYDVAQARCSKKRKPKVE